MARTPSHLEETRTPAPVRESRASRVVSGIGLALLVVVILSFLPLAVPHLMVLQVYAITSGSMEPAIPVGSVVYVRAEDPSEVQDGDVVAYTRSVEGSSVVATVVHRVVENDWAARELITQGDANDSPDPMTVPYANVVGVVVAHFPHLGTLAELYGTTPGKVVALGVAALGLVLNLVAGRMSHRQS